MKWIVAVKEGGEAPRGYGVAWRSGWKQRIYCAPVPLNWVIGWARRAWCHLQYGVRSPSPAELHRERYELKCRVRALEVLADSYDRKLSE